MALPAFRDEAEFRDKWIAPFLTKLGFVTVKNTHGVNEQGKDFYFADYDRFGHTRFFAAQVKLGNIGKGKATSDLLEQVRACFDVKLRFHKSAHEQRIAAVYVMINGTFSAQSREQIHDSCIKLNYGENVFFLDGEQLENKERFATFESDRDRRQLLTAFQYELLHNRSELQRQMSNLGQGKVLFSTYRLSSLDAALQRLSSDDGLLHRDMYKLWLHLTQFTQFTSSIDVSFSDIQKEYFGIMTGDSMVRIETLVTYCQDQLNMLDDQYSLSVSVSHLSQGAAIAKKAVAKKSKKP